MAADTQRYIFALPETCLGGFLRTRPNHRMPFSNLTGLDRLDHPRRRYYHDYEHYKHSKRIPSILNKTIRLALQLYKPSHLLYGQSRLKKAEEVDDPGHAGICILKSEMGVPTRGMQRWAISGVDRGRARTQTSSRNN